MGCVVLPTTWPVEVGLITPCGVEPRRCRPKSGSLFFSQGLCGFGEWPWESARGHSDGDWVRQGGVGAER